MVEYDINVLARNIILGQQAIVQQNEESIKLLKEIALILREENSTEGQLYGFSINLPIGAEGTTKIFFDRRHANNENVPAGTYIYTPNKKLSKLQVINDGPADIRISTNQDETGESLTALLHGGGGNSPNFLSSDDISIEPGKPSISSLFMRASPTVNIADAMATVRVWAIT